MKSNGLATLYTYYVTEEKHISTEYIITISFDHCETFGCSKATSSLSATNSIYCFMRSQFIPINLTGKASVKNYIGKDVCIL